MSRHDRNETVATWSTQELQAPATNDQIVARAFESNVLNNAAGCRLLQQLPWQQKLKARLRSLGLLSITAATFWPTVWVVIILSLMQRAVQMLTAWFSQRQQPVYHQASRSMVTEHPHTRSERLACQTANGSGSEHRHLGPEEGSRPGTAIVTGGKMTKALHVCRHLHTAGWRVVLVETHKYWHVGARFSNSVDAFRNVPVPETHPEQYTQAIVDIAKQEGARLFIPVSSPIASLYDAMVAQALPPQCRSWCLSPATTALLDNKASFSHFAASLGLVVPDHFTITSKEQLMRMNNAEVLAGKTFILKNLSYDSVHRADLFKLPCPPQQLMSYLTRPDVDISEHQPWILQEFIQGEEFSCYTLADQGRVVAHADSAAELSNLNYSYVAHPGIWQWVEQFVRCSGASGQLCFDFIESSADGQLYCIECNPRTSSIITEFHDCPELAAAFIRPGSIKETVKPLPRSRPTYWWFNEVARLLSNPGYFWRFLLTIDQGIDAVFDPNDPLPFLGLHLLQVPMLLLGNVMRGNPWTKVDLCIGKIAELYGD